MIAQDYLFTNIFPTIGELSLEENSKYIYGVSSEDRSTCIESIISNNPTVTFVKVEKEFDDQIELSSLETYSLRSSNQMGELIGECNTLYIDVTGLSNRIAASILNNAMRLFKEKKVENIKVIYVEPELYDVNQFKSEGVFDDLSEKIDGIDPLPGFSTIFPDETDDSLFVVLLGFEGGRFTHMVENVQPVRGQIIPVIGLPGYRIEYPFSAYLGNRMPLENTESWRRVKFAGANSLVDVYILLMDILKTNSNLRIKLAPIGTKPHAIGAMLFAIKYPNLVEIVYDNPKRKLKRGTGIGNVVECFVSKLFEEETF